jgi:lipid-binding SYLF domain-containing protein
MKNVLIAVLGLSVALGAQGKEEDRLRACATVLKEIIDIPDDIPNDLLDKAECVVVFPDVKKFAVGVGGTYGRGAMTCRTGEDFTGEWSAPTLMALEGGSIGFQLGGQSTDFVLLVMNEGGANSVLGSKVKLGADASAAAGPKGRSTGAATDIVMRAEILTYSRARGLFAGVSLSGSTLRPDGGANENLYGHKIKAKQLVQQGGGPFAGALLASTLNSAAPVNKSDPKSLQNVKR